jgi:hypothetical protein
MTFTEAQYRARQLGYAACMDERGGFCLLTVPGVEMLARGSDWESAFERLEKTAQRASVCSECGGRDGGCLWCAGR